MDVRELRDEIEPGSLEWYTVWFQDDDKTEYPVAVVVIDNERRRVVLVGETA